MIIAHRVSHSSRASSSSRESRSGSKSRMPFHVSHTTLRTSRSARATNRASPFSFTLFSTSPTHLTSCASFAHTTAGQSSRSGNDSRSSSSFINQSSIARARRVGATYSVRDVHRRRRLRLRLRLGVRVRLGVRLHRRHDRSSNDRPSASAATTTRARGRDARAGTPGRARCARTAMGRGQKGERMKD